MKFIKTKWIGDKLYEFYLSISKLGIFFEIQLNDLVFGFHATNLRDDSK